MMLIYRQCRKKQQCLWGSSSFLISTLLPSTKQTRFERRWNISTWGWHCLTKAHLINTPHISYTGMWWMLKNPLQLCRRGRITAIVLEIWQSPSCSSACFLSSCAANSFSVLKPSSGFLHPVTGSEFGFLAELISVTFPPAQKWLSSISWLFWGHPTPVSQGMGWGSVFAPWVENCQCPSAPPGLHSSAPALGNSALPSLWISNFSVQASE